MKVHKWTPPTNAQPTHLCGERRNRRALMGGFNCYTPRWARVTCKRCLSRRKKGGKRG